MTPSKRSGNERGVRAEYGFVSDRKRDSVLRPWLRKPVVSQASERRRQRPQQSFAASFRRVRVGLVQRTRRGVALAPSSLQIAISNAPSAASLTRQWRMPAPLGVPKRKRPEEAEPQPQTTVSRSLGSRPGRRLSSLWRPHLVVSTFSSGVTSRPERAQRMRMPTEIDILAKDPERFREVLTPDRFEEFERRAEEARGLLTGRSVWNVSSTSRGGGVVELLRPLLGYARGVGVDARWLVIDGSAEFYEVTKRIHNRLHGFDGDGGPLDSWARQMYEDTLAENVAAFAARVQIGDVVILHDPQPVGMARALQPLAAALIWRCHVGTDEPNDLTREAWSFLRPYVRCADAYVFSRRAFVWEGLDLERVAVIAPSIDPFTAKNSDLAAETVLRVLRACAVVVDGGSAGSVTFRRLDGTSARVERRADMVEDESLRADTPVVAQVSRWDALKDPVGVVRGFAEHVPAETGSHLVCAGPSGSAVTDDPESAQVLHDTIAARSLLPADARRRIHLATLPMDDLDENAVMVNALQRHARVVVQKSIAEGFGLTVTEAMWKSRPVVASSVGGIGEQIVDGESGILLDDPRNLAAFGAAVTDLLRDPPRAEQLGHLARERVRDRFLSTRSLLDYLTVIRRALVDPLPREDR